MKVALYHKGGVVAIEDVAVPMCPPGGVLMKTEASAICTGELMPWYMDRKAPHVLGHECAGIVVESQHPGFSVGARIAPHHHAACRQCELCQKGLFVYCPQWKQTRLDPGGLAEYVAVSAKNLMDTWVTDKVGAQDMALMEPLACVARLVRKTGAHNGRTAIIGLGSLGIMASLYLHNQITGFEVNSQRREEAMQMGIPVGDFDKDQRFSHILVFPGTVAAIQAAISIAEPEATIGIFAPLSPGEYPQMPWEEYYFKGLTFINSYSCDHLDTALSQEAISQGIVSANQIVDRWITLDDVPQAYQDMSSMSIRKAMIRF